MKHKETTISIKPFTRGITCVNDHFPIADFMTLLACRHGKAEVLVLKAPDYRQKPKFQNNDMLACFRCC